jgi:energy-coupling factor transporter ATP-binding protein EcfA2
VELTVGFPVVLLSEASDDQQVIHAWIQAEGPPQVGAGMVQVLINGTHLVDIPVERVPASDPYLSRLTGRRRVSLEFRGQLTDSQLLRQNEAGISELAIDGPSSGLAYFLAHEFAKCFDDGSIRRPQVPVRLLISGRCTEKQGHPVVNPLGPNGLLESKARGAGEFALWLHRHDFDLLPPELRGHVRPFRAPRSSPEWLVQEIVDAHSMQTIAAKEAHAPSCESEQDLFRAAINIDYTPDREDRLSKYFKEYPNRPLLALQSQALLPKNKGLFSDEIGDAVRHVFISGPTGCGKTTLMHSLVLNVMHNREGAALFVGPVKALVEEFHWSLVGGEFSGLLANRARSRCFISTSDYTDNDHLIAKGDFVLASMVYEKASILFDGPTGDAFTDTLSLIVIDEVHMLRDTTRGDVVDMLIAKVARKNHERAEAGQQPIQIVLISTEDVAAALAPLDVFRVADAQEEGKPVELSVSERRPGFDHYLVKRVGNGFKRVFLCNFDDQSKRKLDPNEIRSSLGRICSQLDAVPEKGVLAEALVRGGVVDQPVDEIDRFRTRSLKFVDGLIEQKDHRSVIVVCSAIQLCEALAGGMQDRLDHPVQLHDPDASFLAAVRETEFEKASRERLLSRARRGVFTHHSQMPARLRAAVADAFRKPIRANSRPKVLFTTETLAYGVNLSASALVLTDLEFLRTDPVNPDKLPDRKPLTANQYHNLLGRAGRMGFMDQGPKSAAFIWAPEVWFADDGSSNRPSVDKFLKTYYGRPVAERQLPLSTIAHKADFERLDKDNPPRLRRFSYSIFRTILECVRSAGAGGIPRSEVQSTFRRSIGYMTADDRLRQRLDQLFDKVFGLIIEYQSGELTLLLKRGETYSIQPTAEALLNTGVSLHAVEPIAAWLFVVYRHPGPDASSPLALVPAFVATPEFTQAANELLYLERLKPLFGTQREMELNTDRAKSQARERWMACGLSADLFREVEVYLESKLAMEALSLFDQSMRQACFYLLLAGVLAWLSGASFKDMELAFTALLARRTDNARSWQPKYSDRLEMLVRMTYSFFSQDNGYLTDEMRLALPRFTYQMRYGIPSRAMPYQNVFRPAEVSLPRGVILALDRAVDGNPFSILSQPDGIDVKSILEAAGIDPGDISRERVRQVILDSYRHSLRVFLGRLKDERSGRFVDAVWPALRPDSEGEVEFSPAWEPARLLAVAIQLHAPFVERYVSASRDLTRLRLLSWHDAAEEDTCAITPCAFILLVALHARQALPLDALDSVRALKPRRVSVEWFAREAWDRFADLATWSRLRESLLAFIEPCRD